MAKLDLRRASCELYFCCLGEWKDPPHPKVAIEYIKRDIRDLEIFTDDLVDPVDRHQLRDLWAGATRAQEARLSTVSRFPFPAMEGIENAVVALVKAKDFVDHLVRDSSGNRRPGIFDQNIRDFEGQSNSVNEKMRKTISIPIIKQRFGVMNNGVMIIARDVSPAADSYVLRDYQIVNGCQTSNVLERNRDKLTDEVLLQVRLIQTSSPEVLNDVVEATNSQTPVPSYQFVANSKAAVNIQEFFSTYPDNVHYRLHFERRKYELAEARVSNTRVVTIEDLARTYSAIFLDKPHLVASSPNKVFYSLKDRLFQDDDEPILYYTAAFAHYKLQLLKVRGKLKIPQHRLYWHVLAAARSIAAGKLDLSVNSKKKERHCNTFLAQLWEKGDALNLFQRAYDAINEHTTQLDRDRLRRQAFTDEYLPKI